MCDQCNGNGDAVRFPVSVTVSNFTPMDEAAYVVLYVAQNWHDKWWQPSYPSIINPVTDIDQTLDVCQVPQQFSGAPSFNPTPKPTNARRRLLSGEWNEDYGAVGVAQGVQDSAMEMGSIASGSQRRLDKPQIPPKTAAGSLVDDFQTDDYNTAMLSCCIGSPGQLYMVSPSPLCVSTVEGVIPLESSGQMTIYIYISSTSLFFLQVACVHKDWQSVKETMGKKDKGPPFDDRCVAVSGVCGTTCGAELRQPHDKYCNNGVIPQVSVP